MAAFAAKRPPTSLHVQTWHCLSAKSRFPGHVGTRSGAQGWFAANAAGGRGRGRGRTDASAHEAACRAGLPQMRPEDAAGGGKGRTRRHTERCAGLVCRKCGRRMRPMPEKDGRVGTRSSVQGWFAANAAVQEKNLASAVKNPPNGILSGPNFSLFRQISTTFSHTIISSNSINNYPNEKKAHKE